MRSDNVYLEDMIDKILPYRVTFDTEEVIRWNPYPDSCLVDMLVHQAYSRLSEALYKSRIWEYIDSLSGDRFKAEVKVQGSCIVVAIYDAMYD